MISAPLTAPLRKPLMALLLAALACSRHTHHDEHGHDHGPSTHAEAEEPTVAITRWSEAFELFVELSVPLPGKPVRYHAHVTELARFAPVTAGTFSVRFKKGSSVVKETKQVGVKRPGIFVFASPAPEAGVYSLEMSYEQHGKSDVFDCGSVTVTGKPAPAEEESSSAITFLKEAQWKIPFATDWATERPLSKELELPAAVEPAGSNQLTIGAPTSGRYFHPPKLALAEGLRISKGEILGTIAPNVAGDDFSRLETAVEEARLARDQLQREIARVEPLVQQQLLPERRLFELRNELETQVARLEAAGARLGRVIAPGGKGGLTIRSTLAGVVSEVLVPNGEAVESGSPLLRIGGTEHLWVRARFVAKPSSLLLGATATAVRLVSGKVVELAALGAKFLSPLPQVDPETRIATWIVNVPAESIEKADPGVNSRAELRPGENVVLLVRFGEPTQLLSVQREAVVEINTRPYVFVQIDGEHFEKRPVTLGHTDGPWVHVSSGLRTGDRIVTKGGFDIHLASLMGTVESHRH